jgi:hypothetical protein
MVRTTHLTLSVEYTRVFAVLVKRVYTNTASLAVESEQKKVSAQSTLHNTHYWLLY